MYYSEQMTTRVKEVTEQVEEVKGVLVQNLGNIPLGFLPPPTSKSSITQRINYCLLSSEIIAYSLFPYREGVETWREFGDGRIQRKPNG